jgi:hypothetical protein
MLIFGFFFPRKYQMIQAIHQYENIDTHIHPYIDTSCPSLLPNAETKVLLAASPLLTNWQRTPALEVC